VAKSLLETGIADAQAGQREAARRTLAQVVHDEPDNELAWLWLAAVVDDEWHKLYCLRRVQHINPDNQTAARGIKALAAHLEATPKAEPAAPAPEPLKDTRTLAREPAPPPSPVTSPQPRLHRSRTLAVLGMFVAQRLLFGVVVLAVIAFLSYLGLDMAGGVPLGRAWTSAGTKTLAYLPRLLRGDLGMTMAGSSTYAAVPVAEVVPGLLLKSLGLLAVALVFATVVGVSLGIWAARHRHTGWSLITLLVSVTGTSVPSFFAALLLQLAVIGLTRALGRRLLPVGGFGWDERLILPALVLSTRPIAQIARVTFVSVGDLLDQDFVRTARSKGLGQRLIMYRHVVRNAAVSILTTVGVSLRFSLSSLPVVEFFFSWTGMGFTLLKAIAHRDDNLSVVLLLCLGGLFILVNVALEAMYRLIDPRLRQRVASSELQEREGLLHIVAALAVGGWEWIRELALWRWLRGIKPEPEPSPFRPVLERLGIRSGAGSEVHKAQRQRSWLRGTVRNVPLVVGGIVVIVLLATVLIGPRLTPHSPYTKHGLEYSDGQLRVPPFAPDDDYIWGSDALGRDVFSLVIAGAQQTLLLAALVVSVRVALGVVLGSLAGWLHGSWVDRSLLGAAEVVAAFPALLLAMTLVLALGIRQGMRPFIIALSFVGWGEMMQFVRGEVMTIRVKPYIDSAVATGLRTPRLVWTHVLPNLLPSLVSIAALEMGAVLMLLGELGFVGIFIGGGAFAELQIDAPPYHYSDVPEWGALLSNIRLYARAYPWTATYPALAFFVSILGFNLFGEGIRRMIETVGLRLSRVVRHTIVAAVVLLIVGIGWAKGNVGGVAYYRRQAEAFDGAHALAYAQALADPALDGRALGTPGHEAAADRIAQWFASVGLQPGGEGLGFFQERSRSCEIIDAEPRLSLVGQDTGWAYRQDYADYAGSHRNMGQVTGTVRVLGMRDLTLVNTNYAGSYYKPLDDLDLADRVVMVLSDQGAFYVQRNMVGGLLVVTEDEADLRRKYTQSSRNPIWNVYGAGRAVGQDTPMLRISQDVADRILEGSGVTLDDLRKQREQLGTDEILDLSTDAAVSMEVRGEVQEKIPVRNVIGHLPGLSDSRYGGMNTQAIVVLAQYDAPPPSPEGAFYPAANDNASGVAVMMEAVRTMRETGYQPYRTFLFIAYSGEGLEGGESVSPSDVSKFLQAHSGFVSSLDVEAIVHVRGVGAGDGETLTFSAQGSRRLASLFERSAHSMGVRTQQVKDVVDIGIIFDDKSRWERGQEAPEIALSWEGWEATSRMPTDVAENLDVDRIEQAGRALTLALMMLGREQQY
jgi:ABC-type dipeptide/oligopeptide/nickel transport system permease component